MNQIKVTDKLLDEAVFWSIIERSIKDSEDIDEQEALLITAIEQLSVEEIIGFKLTLNKLAADIHTSAMWCAGYLMNDGCSDDGFDYFKSWVISRGKAVYDKAQKNPDTLADYVGDEDYYEFESLDYVAVEAFENKTAANLYDYLPEQSHLYSDIEFTWAEDDEESLKAICPTIFDKVS